MARVNWLLSNCCSLAWVTKHVRRSKQNPRSLARLCSPSFFIFVFLFLQFPFWRFFKRRSAHYLPLLIHSPWTRKHLSRHRLCKLNDKSKKFRSLTTMRFMLLLYTHRGHLFNVKTCPVLYPGSLPPLHVHNMCAQRHTHIYRSRHL